MTHEELVNEYKLQQNQINTQNEEIIKLKELIENLYTIISNNNNNNNNNNYDSNNKELSIIFKRYKKSIMVKNMFPDKNTTIKWKDVLKTLDAKWIKNDTEMGWLLIGKFDDAKTLEQNCDYIITTLKENKFTVEFDFE